MMFTDAELEAYLDEALPAGRTTAVEDALRTDRDLAERLTAINARRDAGLHSLGEIWRRGRLSCPSRQELGNFLLRVLPEPAAQYIDFHVEQIGCRHCLANLEDLRNQQADVPSESESRRRRYFQSSAGYLKK